jgi:ParB family chromosome partitioning protein
MNAVSKSSGTPLGVQIRIAYGKPGDGAPVIPRNKYVEIRHDKPKGKNQRDWPEYKTCKYATEAIVTEGTEKGETKRVCANPDCPVHQLLQFMSTSVIWTRHQSALNILKCQ